MINCLEFFLDRFIFVTCQKGISTKLLDNSLLSNQVKFFFIKNPLLITEVTGYCS